MLIVITLAEVGGAQSYVTSLLPALAERFDVTVAAHGDGPVRETAQALRLPYVPLRHLRRPISPWRDPLALAELVRLIRRARPDVVHVSSSKAGVLGRLAAWALGVPVRVFTVHGWAFAAKGGPSSLLYRWADRLISPMTTATICVSELERSSGLAARTCVAERTVVIPNAVDVRGAPRARSTRSRPLLVAVGRLRPPKDFETLLQALALLPADAFEAAIVGDGPQRAELEALRTQLGLQDRVRLEGERRDVPAVLADADAFVLSSRSEGLPVSVLEAMAAGLPVVASAVGGVGELVVDGDTGLLVRPADAEAMAAALATVVADPTLRRRLGEAGRARAEELFDLEPCRRAHVALYMRELDRAGLSVPVP